MDLSHFRTLIKPKTKDKQIDYKSKTLLMGSCFSSHMAKKLKYFKFDVLANPFGILFHPQAILQTLKEITEKKQYKPNDLIHFNGRWQSFSHHSAFSHLDNTTCLKNIQESIDLAHDYLKNCNHIILTLGSAWHYFHQNTNRWVANCHKIPQKEFTKHLSSFEELTATLNQIVGILKTFNPKIAIGFTLSPVRHIKDGMEENAVSKAILRAAIDRCCKENNCYYFPSYELIQDDLRDYRFYSSDLIHINDQGIEYVWEHFKKACIAKKCETVMKKVDAVQKGLHHRPFDEKSQAHQDFLKKLELNVLELKEKYQIDFYSETY